MLNGWTQLEGDRVEPSLADLFVEKLDAAVAGEDVVHVIRGEGLVSAGVDECQGEVLDAFVITVVGRAGKASNVVSTEVALAHGVVLVG